MRERPILFSGPMVRAIFAGTKTQTRRIVAERHLATWEGTIGWALELLRKCPYGAPGDRLWVRETWGRRELGSFGREKWDPVYRATDEEAINRRFREFQWVPSIHMPRDVSRLTLEVVSVRVERLQEISEEDAKAEGVQAAPFCKAGRTNGLEHVEAFEDLWDDINDKRAAWKSNPWVWRVEFRRVTS